MGFRIIQMWQEEDGTGGGGTDVGESEAIEESTGANYTDFIDTNAVEGIINANDTSPAGIKGIISSTRNLLRKGEVERYKIDERYEREALKEQLENMKTMALVQSAQALTGLVSAGANLYSSISQSNILKQQEKKNFEYGVKGGFDGSYEDWQATNSELKTAFIKKGAFSTDTIATQTRESTNKSLLNVETQDKEVNIEKVKKAEDFVKANKPTKIAVIEKAGYFKVTEEMAKNKELQAVGATPGDYIKLDKTGKAKHQVWSKDLIVEPPENDITESKGWAKETTFSKVDASTIKKKHRLHGPPGEEVYVPAPYEFHFNEDRTQAWFLDENDKKQYITANDVWNILEVYKNHPDNMMNWAKQGNGVRLNFSVFEENFRKGN